MIEDRHARDNEGGTLLAFSIAGHWGDKQYTMPGA